MTTFATYDTDVSDMVAVHKALAGRAGRGTGITSPPPALTRSVSK